MMAYDSASGQAVLFGGQDSSGNILADTWTYQLGAAQTPVSAVGTPAAQTPVYFLITASGTLPTLSNANVLTQGTSGLDFTLGTGSTCTGAVTAGQTCTVNVAFTPWAPGQRLGAVNLNNASGTTIATALISGTGIGAAAVFPSNTSTTTLGSGFSRPFGVAVDAAGDVYVADTLNYAVEEIVAVGGSIPANNPTILTLGSNFNQPQGVAVDSAGNAYVADTINGAVREIVAVGGSIPASNPKILTLGHAFSQPISVAVDGTGDVYVAADSQHSAVKEIHLTIPPVVSFNSTVVGSTSSDSPETVVLQNIGNAPLIFPGLSTGNNPSVATGFSLGTGAGTCPQVAMNGTAASLAAGAMCNESISFTPTMAGSDNGHVSLTDNSLGMVDSNGNGNAMQSIPVTGTGTAATVTGISPQAGPTAGGTTVTITGTGFSTTASSNTVKFGSNTATVTAATTTSLTVTAPAATSAGTVDVTVTVDSATSATSSSDQFTYDAAPTATSLSPTAGPVAGGTSVTVTGTGFVNGSTSVTIGGTTVPASSVTLNSATSLTFATPAHAAGNVSVTVTTPGGTSNAISGGYTYASVPTIASIAPSFGAAAGGTTVTITGTGFISATAVNFGSTAAANFTVSSDTQIIATSPAGAAGAVVDITVTTGGGTSATSSADQYTYQSAASSAYSTVVVSPGPAVAGSTPTVMATLKDASGNAINGATATFSSTSSTVNFGTPTVNGNVITTTMTDTVAESAPITVTLSGGASGTLAGSEVFVAPAYIVTTNSDSTTGTCVDPNISTSGNSTCNLRQAINAANSLTGVTTNISFAIGSAAAPATITIGSGLGAMAISQSVNINGPGANALTIQGGATPLATTNQPIFSIDSADVSLNGLTIANGYNSDEGGAVRELNGTLSINQSVFTGNSVFFGGGAIWGQGNLKISGSTFSGNQARAGGAILSGANPLTISDSTFSGNGGQQGGAVYANGLLTVGNSTFSGNSATETGDAIDTNAANFTNDIFTGNNASSGTGGAGVVARSGSASNLVYTDTISGVTPTNSFNADPNLSAMGNYGGTTQTFLPLPGSPAICAGTQPVVRGTVLTTDQRGIALSSTRYGQSVCYDIGAVQTNYSLLFSTQPSAIAPATGIVAKENFQAAVTITENGLTSPAASSVPLTLTTGQGTLSNGTQTSSNGVATYNTLQINHSGAGDQLTATLAVTSVANITATSASFNVGTALSVSTAVPSTTLTQNYLATTFTPVTGNGGTGTIGYSVSPTLPSGLVFSTTGMVSGTPSAASAATTYMVTVTDANGTTATSTFSLTVNGAVTATVVSASTTLTADQASTTFTPVTGSGGTGTLTYSVSPMLPSGLAFSAPTGAISGSPTGISSVTTYTVTITDANGATAQAGFSLTVAAEASVIAFSVPNHTYGDQPFQVSATSNSAGVFMYSVASGPATISGNVVTLTGAGSVTLTASQAASGKYAATSKNATFSVAAGNAPITFTVPNHTYGDAPFAVSATSSSTGAFTYSVVSGLATISGSTVTLTGAGTVVLKASQAADNSYAGNSQNATFTIAAGTASITFAVPNHTYGDAPFAVSASSSSTGPFTYSVVSGPSTISGNIVTLTGAGTVVLKASQAADSNYAASSQNATFAVAAGTASITFNVANHTYGDAPFGVSASSSSTGAFTYSVASGPATISGSTVTLTGAGTVVLKASQAADSNYAASTQNATFTVTAGTAAITFLVPNHTYGDAPFTVSASSLSTGAFTYSVVGGPATISGSTVTLTGAGTVTLKASQVADSNYAANAQNATFTVAAGTSAITFIVSNHTYGDAPFAVNASSASTGAFIYSVVSGNVTMNGSTVSINGIGAVTLQASQAADSNYAASAKQASFSIAAAPLVITATNTARPYGLSNPVFTGTVTGQKYSDTFAESFSTTASSTSAPGTYTIVPTVMGANLADYTVTASNGTLTISQAATTTTLTTSTTQLSPTQPVTLTVTVASSTTGVPTGTAVITDNGVALTTVTLSNGTATYSTALSSGTSHNLIATYSGDVDYLGSAPSANTVVVSPLGFTFAPTTTNTALTGAPGSTLSYSFNIAPGPGGYPAPVTFSVTGLPSGATASFTPASIAANGGVQTVTLSIRLPSAIGESRSPFDKGEGRTTAFFALLLPLAFSGRLRRKLCGHVLMSVLLLAGLAGVTAITACGTGGGFLLEKPSTYTVNVTATSGSVSHTDTITLTVQ